MAQQHRPAPLAATPAGAPASKGPAVGILTRAPQPGRTKTRLAAVIGDLAAADLATAMLQDTVEAVSGGSWHTALFVEPPQAIERIGRLLGPRRPDLRAQSPGDIGARMHHAAATLLQEGWGPVVLVGSDIPGLGRTQITAALSALSEPHSPTKPDAVFGPADDGGYFLVALRHLREGREADLFGTTIPWGTSAVLARSQAAAARAGLRIELLDAQNDIDTVADLVSLRARLVTPDTNVRLSGPRTQAVVARLDLGAGAPDEASDAADEEHAE